MTLGYDEMIQILEDLARHSPSAIAKIQAIKTLRLLEAERKEAEEAEEKASAFDQLYAVPNPRTSNPSGNRGMSEAGSLRQ